MKKQIETIQKMSETLESSGFTRDQSVAVVSSIALAMKNFAVTPELLDERLARQSRELSREWNQRFNEHKAETNQRFDQTQQLLRNQTRSVFALTLVILAGALGLVGVMLDA